MGVGVGVVVGVRVGVLPSYHPLAAPSRRGVPRAEGIDLVRGRGRGRGRGRC